MSEVNTREKIVREADRLFYECGYENTSFATIAEMVGISRGNFYHHFKSKDDILSAVIGLRLTQRQSLLERWEMQDEQPASRIRSFIQILLVNQSKIMKHGCPVGTLCTELAKLDHPLRDEAAQVMELFRTWLRRQFAAMGHAKAADELALHVLALSQGVAILAQTYGDKAFIRREVERMCAWVDAQVIKD
jgi:AcrR family transcriptional regulator